MDARAVVDAQYGSTTARLDARVALHEAFSVAPVHWLDWVFDQLDLSNAEVLLEVGTGTGGLWAHNQARIPPGLGLVLTDISPAMCEHLQRLSLPNTSVVRADVLALPLQDDSADVVVADHMLYHAASPATALAEISRVLRHGGRVYAATNGRGHMQELEAVAEASGVPYGSMRLHHPFLLEDAAEMMRRHFDDIDVAIFDDSLAVTEVDPVVSYLESVVELSSSQRRDIAATVNAAIADNGAFTITKSVGMIRARG